MTEKVVPKRDRRCQHSMPIAVVAALLIVCASLAPLRAEETGRSQRALANRLVQQLGHEEFAMREQAAAGLIELQINSETALRAGMLSQNREIRYRCGKLLGVVLDLDLQHRFELFKESTDPEQDYGLPGWDAYREVAGDSPMARSIFVSMHETESKLLAMSAKSPRQLNVALQNRCQEIAGSSMFGQVDVGIGTTGTLLFLATIDAVELNSIVASTISMACRNRSFALATESQVARDVLLRMAERWIARQPRDGISYALHLGLTHDLQAVLPRAREMLLPPKASVTDQIYACHCLAKYGDQSDIGPLESCLEDVTVFGQVQVDGKFITSQMRDVALATLVMIAKQEPADFGFDRFRADPRLVFDHNSVGFLDEQSRAAAIEKWREYRSRIN